MLMIPKFIPSYKPGHLSIYGSNGIANVHQKQHTSKTYLPNSSSKAIWSYHFPHLSWRHLSRYLGQKSLESHLTTLSFPCHSTSAANCFDPTLKICPQFCFSSLFDVAYRDQAAILPKSDHQKNLQTVVPKPLHSVLNIAITQWFC